MPSETPDRPLKRPLLLRTTEVIRYSEPTNTLDAESSPFRHGEDVNKRTKLSTVYRLEVEDAATDPPSDTASDESGL
jgi:hypothetical protein